MATATQPIKRLLSLLLHGCKEPSKESTERCPYGTNPLQNAVPRSGLPGPCMANVGRLHLQVRYQCRAHLLQLDCKAYLSTALQCSPFLRSCGISTRLCLDLRLGLASG